MAKPSNDGNIVKRTSQYIDNTSYDETTSVKGMAIFGTPDGSNVYRAQVDSSGNLKVAGTISVDTTGLATASNQTDKSQFTKITDGTDTALVTAAGEQNVLESNSAAIKTAVETIDNIVSGSGVNQTQVGGTNIDTNSGNKSAGTQRVVLATDQPQLTNALKVDGSAITQPVSGTVTTNETVPTTIYNGLKNVTTAGTRVALASSQAVKSVTIKAKTTNTGIIYVGDGSVASTTGYQLYAGDTVTLDIANLSTVNLDSSVNGEGVTYIGVN